MPIRFGSYELLRLISRGGMAEIFVAQHIQNRKIVAIKRLLPQVANDQRFRESLIAEAQLAAAVKHPNVVDIIELGQEDEQIYIAMEYIAGCDLRVLLREATKRGYRVPPWLSLYVVSQILHALAHAHNTRALNGGYDAIVHADLTPSNIFISHQGKIKLGDFGIARSATNNASHPFELAGKLAYLAPELYTGHRPDPQTDVFSMGVILWEMLTQRRLFGGQAQDAIIRSVLHGERVSPSHLMEDIPEELSGIALDAVAIGRSERTASAAGFVDQLGQVFPTLNHHSITHHLPSVINGLLGRKHPPYADLFPLELSRKQPDQHRAPTITKVPHFWWRTPETPARGGYEAQQLLRWCLDLPKPSVASSVTSSPASGEISVDGKHWITSEQFSKLSHICAPPTPISRELKDHVTWQATSREHAWPAVLITLTRARASGALLVAPLAQAFPDPWVLYIREGRLVELMPPQRSPSDAQLLIRSGVFSSATLAHAIRYLLIHEVPLAHALCAVEHRIAESTVKNIVTGQHIANIVSTPDLQFSFSTLSSTLPRPYPSVTSLLEPLPQTILQAMTLEHMQTYVITQSEQQWVPCIDYQAMINAFSFPADMANIAMQIGQQQPAPAFFEGEPKIVQPRCVVAYLLLQAQLLKLLPSPSPTNACSA